MTNDQKITMLSPPSDCSMDDKWYEFATADHFWMKWRFEALKRIIPQDYAWGQTLDIGCGIGVARDQIENSYGAEVIGCDLNMEALQMAAMGTSTLYCYNIHHQREELKEKFSTILLLDVLEHIEDPVPFLKAVSFHLKKESRLLINVPAFQSFYSSYDKTIGHIKRYNITSLEKELDSAGFRMEKASYWGMSLIPLLIIRKLFTSFYKKEHIIKAGFQPKSTLIDFFLNYLMRIEVKLFPQPPIGTSLIVTAQKK